MHMVGCTGRGANAHAPTARDFDSVQHRATRTPIERLPHDCHAQVTTALPRTRDTRFVAIHQHVARASHMIAWHGPVQSSACRLWHMLVAESVPSDHQRLRAMPGARLPQAPPTPPLPHPRRERRLRPAQIRQPRSPTRQPRLALERCVGLEAPEHGGVLTNGDHLLRA